jgi:hypothetical protein
MTRQRRNPSRRQYTLQGVYSDFRFEDAATPELLLSFLYRIMEGLPMTHPPNRLEDHFNSIRQDEFFQNNANSP